jgi:two-component system, NarL family, invasion response regulator UvrY
MRILIADDHPLVRRGVKDLLRETFPDASIGEAGDLAGVMKAVRGAAWDIILLDLSMPGATGLEGLLKLKRACPDVPALVFSVHAEEQYAVRALKAGAMGYLTKDHSTEELLKAVKHLLARRRYVSAALAERLALDLTVESEKPLHEQLSQQEFRVLCLIGQGQTVSEIAQRLHLSVKTVSTYRARLLEKMQMRNNAELMRYCVDHHLVD